MLFSLSPRTGIGPRSGENGAPSVCEALDTLLNELERYRPGLTTKPAIVAANKMDVRGADITIALLERQTDWPVVPISSMHGYGIPTLTSQLRRIIQPIKDEKAVLKGREDFLKTIHKFNPGQ